MLLITFLVAAPFVIGEYNYEFVEERITWTHAKSKCEIGQGQLFAPGGEFEWNFVIQKMMNTGAPSSKYYWIGVKRGPGQSILDVSGEADIEMKFTLWNIDDTNNLDFGQLRYLESGDKYMVTRTSSLPRRYICKNAGKFFKTYMIMTLSYYNHPF